MAKKNLVRKSPRTQALRKRKRTPPKKGQPVKAKTPGRMGRPLLSEENPGTGNGTLGLFEYLSTCSPVSLDNFLLSRLNKISNSHRRLREDFGELVNFEVEYRLVSLVAQLQALWKLQQKSEVISSTLLQEAPESAKIAHLSHPLTERNEPRKAQTVNEQEEWRIHFERFGCLECHRQDRKHGGHGFCQGCVSKVINRLERIRKRGIKRL